MASATAATESVAFNIRLADDGEYYLLLYFAVSLRRISEGYPLTDFSAEDVDDEVRAAASHIVNLMRPVVGKAISRQKKPVCGLIRRTAG